MNFLHLIPYAHNGGTEKDCYYIIKEDTVNKHTVLVFDNPGPMSDRWADVGAKVVHCNILKDSLFSFGAKLRKKLAKTTYDGFFYWSTIRLPMVRHALSRQYGKLAVHAGNPAGRGFVALKNNVLHRLFPSTIPTRLFSCSAFVKASLTEDPYYSKFRSQVSLNPVNIPGDNSYSARELDESSIINIGMVARLDPIKDHKTAIKAFAAVSQNFSNAKLHFVGDGRLKSQLMLLTEKFGIANRVIFHGDCNHIYAFLKSWDLFIYATTLQEGLGNAVSEALANGLPCVLTDLPMLREIIGDTESALFCKPGDAADMAEKMQTLILNESLRRKFSANGYRRAKAALSADRYLKDRMDYLLS